MFLKIESSVLVQLLAYFTRPTARRFISVGFVILLMGCGSKDRNVSPPPPQVGGDQNLPAVMQTARLAEELGIEIGQTSEKGIRGNFAGLRTDEVMFSRRLDSRSYFAYDRRFTVSHGLYQGPDEKVASEARTVLAKLSVPSGELGSAKVIEEAGQTGHLDPGTRKLSLGKVTRGKRYVMFTRQVEGMPVFSSRAIIGFTSEGRLGFLNVHWPVISEADLKETRELRERVRRGWKAPVVSGARVESVEAGIVPFPFAAAIMEKHPVNPVLFTKKDTHFGLLARVFFLRERVSLF